jgi:putative DNA primase/helicase
MTALQQDLSSPLAHDDGGSEQDVFITELATLSPLEFGRRRRSAAEELGVPLRFLDEAVKNQQHSREHGDSGGEGSTLLFQDIAPWMEEVDGTQLVSDLCAAIQMHVVVPDDDYLKVALWILLTHTHEAHSVSPILTITAPEPACGKTTLLDTISWLVPKPLPTSGVTAAVVYRVIEQAQPTLLTDELDSLPPETRDALRGIYNAGHTRRFASVMRNVRLGDRWETRRFNVWAPKAIAQIGYPAKTISSRSIIIELSRKPASYQVRKLPPDGTADLNRLARQCARWANDHEGPLAESEPSLPESLGNREADNWTPLFAIADRIGGEWPERIRMAAQRTPRADAETTLGVQLLEDINTIFKRLNTGKLESSRICSELHQLEERPWPEYGRSRKPITPTQLARLLSRYKISPRTVRLDGRQRARNTAKGYVLGDFTQAFVSYLPNQAVTPSQPRETAADSVVQAVTSLSDVTATNDPKPADIGQCDGVTAQHGGPAGNTSTFEWEDDPEERAALQDPRTH